jgi:ubiquinone/menaquinone biosynthesis C-methylase UbiE
VAPLSSFSEHDRVLFLSPPEDGFLHAVATRLTAGLVVVLGSDDQVSHGRRQHSSLDNVMFVAASAEEIPWQDGFFTQVIDPAGLWTDSPKAALESARVLSPNDR